MWFLYKIDKENRFNSILYMRLRPNTRNPLVTSMSRSSEARAYVLVGDMSLRDAERASFKPEILLESNNLDIRVDVNLIREQTTYLHDQQIIHLIDSDTQFKICWEPLSVYHIKSNDHIAHEQLVKMASEYGFQVLCSMDHQKVTHYYLDQQILTHNDQPSYSLLTALVYLLPCVNPTWLEGFRLEDRHYDRKSHDQSINTTLLENYGPLKKTAFLGIDMRRKHLFQGLEFWFFDQQQYDKYSLLVNKAGGKSQLATLQEGLSENIPRDALFVEHPYLSDAAMEETWRTVQKRFQDEIKCERCIVEWEIEYSIMYCSTNMMCNPCSDLLRYISYHDPLYKSLEAASATVRIKEEPLDDSPLRPTVPCSMNNSTVFLDQATLSRYSASSYNTMLRQNDTARMVETAPTDRTVRVVETAPTDHTVRVVETAPTDHTVRVVEVVPINHTRGTDNPTLSYGTLRAAETIPMDNEDTTYLTKSSFTRETLPVGSTTSASEFAYLDEIENKKHNTPCARRSSLLPNLNAEPEEDETSHDIDINYSDLNSNDIPLSIDIDMNPSTMDLDTNAASPSLEGLVDLNSFYNNMFVNQNESKMQSKCLQEEHEQRLRNEQEQKKREEHEQRLRNEQEQKKREELEEKEQLERENRERALLEREQRIREEEERYSQEILARKRRIEERERDLGIENNSESDPGPSMPNTSIARISSRKPTTSTQSYSKIVYAPIVVKSRPPAISRQSAPNQSSVNFKRFKKVRQFESHQGLDFVTLVSSSQAADIRINQEADTNRATSFMQFEGADQFDPDIAIQASRRRK